jgi:hypothetical protein
MFVSLDDQAVSNRSLRLKDLLLSNSLCEERSLEPGHTIIRSPLLPGNCTENQEQELISCCVENLEDDIKHGDDDECW